MFRVFNKEGYKVNILTFYNISRLSNIVLNKIRHSSRSSSIWQKISFSSVEKTYFFQRNNFIFETSPFHFDLKYRQTGRQIIGRDQTDRQTQKRSDRQAKERVRDQTDKRGRDQADRQER